MSLENNYSYLVGGVGRFPMVALFASLILFTLPVDAQTSSANRQWTQIIEVTGKGLASPNALTDVHREMTALEAAKNRARAELAERIRGARVTRTSSVRDMAFAGEEVSIEMDAIIEGAHVIREVYNKETGIAEVTMVVGLDADGNMVLQNPLGRMATTMQPDTSATPVEDRTLVRAPVVIPTEPVVRTRPDKKVETRRDAPSARQPSSHQVDGLSANVLSGRAATPVRPHYDMSVFGEGQLTLGGRGSSDAHEVIADGLFPLVNTGELVVFLNLRGSVWEDDDQEQSASAGLVLRRLARDQDIIFGANVYYDRHWSRNDNSFGQVGGGVELLSTWVDIRANYYYPLDDEKVTTLSEDEIVRQNGFATVRGSVTTSIYEEPLEGWDAEISLWLPLLSRFAPTSISAGYYSFSSDFQDDLTGWKARLESRIHPNVTLDAQWFEETEWNRTDYLVGLRIHVPLDFWNGLRFDRAPENHRVRPFEARISDMVQREFRIRTIETEPIREAKTKEVIPRPRPTTPEPDPEPQPEPDCFIIFDEDGNPILICN